MAKVNRPAPLSPEQRSSLVSCQFKTYLQFSPLNATDAAGRIAPAEFGAESQFRFRQVVSARHQDLLLDGLPAGAERSRVLSACCTSSRKENPCHIGPSIKSYLAWPLMPTISRMSSFESQVAVSGFLLRPIEFASLFQL